MILDLRQSENRIARLECWHGEIELVPLEGGMTNRNYVVRDSGRRYVARVGEDLPHLGIDRRSEAACQAAAHRNGVAPAVIWREDGVLVSEFVSGAALTADCAREPERLERVAKLIRRLHEGWRSVSGELLFFSPFLTVRTYLENARRLGAAVSPAVECAVDDASELEARLVPYRPALCHNDLLPANVMDDGARLQLVDWEYAGVGHPLFDVAGLAGNCGLDADAEAELLRAYRGSVDEEDLRSLRILKAVSLLREALWGTIQTVASEIEFDYASYAAENLDAYRNAREELR